MIEKIKTWAIVVLVVAFFTLLFVAVMLLPGCMTAPSRDDYKTEAGFAQANCMYQNKENPDKSVCNPLVKIYCDELQEAARIKRLEYCKDKRPADMSERECRMWLNEK